MADQSIVKSFNIFLDSALGDSSSRGDDYNLHLNSSGLTCDRGQFFRFTVKNFSMFRTFPNVNATNSNFQIRTPNMSNFSNLTPTQNATIKEIRTLGSLQHKNYQTVHYVADAFATALGDTITNHIQVIDDNRVLASSGAANDAYTLAYTLSNIVPASTTTTVGNTDNIISFTITFDKDIPDEILGYTSQSATTTITNTYPYTNGTDIFNYNKDCFKVRLINDAYALLGGNRFQASSDTVQFSSIEINVDETVTVSGSSTVTTLDKSKIHVQCLYPAQRMTAQFVYLRSSLISSNLESNNFSHAYGAHPNSDVHHSNIMGRFPADTEFCQYDSSSGREFITDVPNSSHIQNIRFWLTDAKSRPLSDLTTYAGTTGTTKQTTLGNLNFSLALRVDVIQKFVGETSFTPAVPRTVTPRFSKPTISTEKVEG